MVRFGQNDEQLRVQSSEGGAGQQITIAPASSKSTSTSAARTPMKIEVLDSDEDDNDENSSKTSASSPVNSTRVDWLNAFSSTSHLSTAQLLLCIAAAASTVVASNSLLHSTATPSSSSSASASSFVTTAGAPSVRLSPNVLADHVVMERSLALVARLCKQPETRAQLLEPDGFVMQVGRHRHHVFAVDVWLAALVSGAKFSSSSSSSPATAAAVSPHAFDEATCDACLRALLYCAESRRYGDAVLDRIAKFHKPASTVTVSSTFSKSSAAEGAALPSGLDVLCQAVSASNRLLAGNAALALGKLALKPDVLPGLGAGASMRSKLNALNVIVGSCQF